MKFTRCILFVTTLCFGFMISGRVIFAASVEAAQEGIESFVADIRVNTDNSISVTETIVYNTGAEAHHGIYRDIYPYSSQERKMDIDNVRVVDELGKPHLFDTFQSGKNLRIRIGDPDVTFVGQKTYVIYYRATKAIAQFEEFDEIYWNVTGLEWDMPITTASAFVTLPAGAHATQSACYFGLYGSTERCAVSPDADGVHAFTLPYSLNAFEGLTVAVGFEKGIMDSYTAADDFDLFLQKYLSWIIGIGLPVITLLLSLRYWYFRGRDPKGRATIIPQYDVPDNLTPMEVAGIAQESVNAKHISAEIVYLATRGYLSIRALEKKTLGFVKSTDYELTKLKDPSDLPNAFDKNLMNALFKKGATSVTLSSLKNIFYKKIPPIITAVLDGLVSKTYYKNLGKMKQSASWGIILFFIFVWGSVLLGNVLDSFAFVINFLPMIIGFVLSVIIYAVIFYFSPAKTEKGVATKEYILGLKEYLQIAEKDRLEFHNAPAKTPEVFEQLLPYAMVLGVTAIWAKEFEGIALEQPGWYSSSNHAVFNTMVFAHTLNSFSVLTRSSLTASPSSSGSGGGGFSGGGGGGGGGGSW